MDNLRNYVSYSILIIFLFSCSNADQKNSVVSHPQPEYFPFEQDSVNLIAGSSQNKSDTTAVLQRLKSAAQAIQIGAKTGGSNTTLGRIRGVVSDSPGNIYVLDSQNEEVKVFDEEGEYQHSFGKGGPGPGEFQSPEDIDIGSDGRLYIADRNHAINVFAREDSTYEYETTIKIHVIPDAFCILKDKLFIRGIGPDRSAETDTTNLKTIHTYSSETGEYLYSFGKPYNSPNIFILRQLSDGLIACNETTNMVISTFDMMSYILGYTTEGKFSWVTGIEEFNQRPITQQGEGSVRMGGSDDTVSSIDPVVPIAQSKWFLVQVVERPAGRNVDLDNIKLHSYLVSSENGEGMNIGQDIPRLFFVNESRLFGSGLLTHSYPNILVYDY